MTNRWSIAVAGVLLQVALGAVYAWSVFRAPLTKQFGWSISEVTLTFTITIFVLGITAFFGALWDHDLRGLMRRGASNGELMEFICTAVSRKEERHHIGEPGFVPPSRTMVHIGG